MMLSSMNKGNIKALSKSSSESSENYLCKSLVSPSSSSSASSQSSWSSFWFWFYFYLISGSSTSYSSSVSQSSSSFDWFWGLDYLGGGILNFILKILFFPPLFRPPLTLNKSLNIYSIYKLRSTPDIHYPS